MPPRQTLKTFAPDDSSSAKTLDTTFSPTHRAIGKITEGHNLLRSLEINPTASDLHRRQLLLGSFSITYGSIGSYGTNGTYGTDGERRMQELFLWETQKMHPER